jgi:ribosome-associated heat shock protein Hsp15
MSNADDSERVRLDKWLWAARFFKTRSLATDAVTGGKVEVNGDHAKPAKAIKPGDEVRLRLGPYEHVLIVRALADRRGSATIAQALYGAAQDGARGIRVRGKRPANEEGSTRPVQLHRSEAPVVSPRLGAWDNRPGNALRLIA